jgi:hypothetical protein
MSNWNPKPLNNALEKAMNSLEAPEITITRGRSDMERQRHRDGTPIGASPPSALQPPQVPLQLDGVKKGSLAANIKGGTKSPVKTDPPINPSMVVKSYMAWLSKE